MESRKNGAAAITEQVLDLVPIGIVVVNAEGRIVYLNDAYERILGVPRYKVLGRLMKDIEPGATLLDVLESGHEVRERTVRIHSINRQVKVNILPLRSDTTLLGVVSFFEDVTESRELSHELIRVRKLADHFREELETQRELPRSFSEIEGRDPGFMKVLGQAAIVADTDAPVLLLGENGTGKEVMARAIHAASRRAGGPFIAVNCAAVPESLLESELFGYEEGSFTGASKGGRMGKFELAEGGTLFLDEIGDMPYLMQSKLLRVLQEKEIEKIGRSGTMCVNVRIIAATNKNIRKLSETGVFRQDLYYRLNVVGIVLPPLRERGDDVLLLAANMLKKFNSRYGKNLTLSKDVLQTLRQHVWPGNVRELANSLEHAVIMCEQGSIEVRHLPHGLGQDTGIRTPDSGRRDAQGRGAQNSAASEPHPVEDWHTAISRLERRMLTEALAASGGNRSLAMRNLGMSRRTFYKKLHEYGLGEDKAF